MRARPSSDIRPSAIAGAWYPDNPAALRRAVKQALDQSEPVALPGRLAALVSPHAGFAYSGGVAARAYAQARGAGFRRVVLLGPLHRPMWGHRMGPVMAPSEVAFSTPLGPVPVDREAVDALSRRVSIIPVRGDEEHSLEIQLPFLQVALGEFSLVPLLLSVDIADRQAMPLLDCLADGLAGLADSRTLLVASTDLSHLHDDAEVARIDQRLADLVGAFDVDGLARALQREEVNACGGAGLVAVMKAARARGAAGATVLARATSGDITGEKRPGQYSVGYLAAAVYHTHTQVPGLPGLANA
jgi:AmmeMemoRadiSam system protein B